MPERKSREGLVGTWSLFSGKSTLESGSPAERVCMRVVVVVMCCPFLRYESLRLEVITKRWWRQQEVLKSLILYPSKGTVVKSLRLKRETPVVTMC